MSCPRSIESLWAKEENIKLSPLIVQHSYQTLWCPQFRWETLQLELDRESWAYSLDYQPSLGLSRFGPTLPWSHGPVDGHWAQYHLTSIVVDFQLHRLIMLSHSTTSSSSLGMLWETLPMHLWKPYHKLEVLLFLHQNNQIGIIKTSWSN